MDDIYGDLENYNDVNALDELRNENMQLKFKLEEYASDMKKLQKDFDKVSSEFKSLEINYSSLLKTAKAEIERKTQIICNLNSEKDMMVLNSIQNTNKSILDIRRVLLREKSHNYNLRTMKKDSNVDCGKTNRKDFRDSKKLDFEKERKDEIRIPSVDTTTSVSTEECMEKKLGKCNTYEKNSDTKENIIKNKSRAQSIRNRRKSMPILGKQLPKFSSDEENDDNSADETKKKDRYSRDEKSRRNTERNYTEKVVNKISETSGIDEKYSSYHESSRETYYRGKFSRQSDKHKSTRDKYEQSQRLRRHFSPERSLRKAPRDHSTEYYQRSDYGRHRVLESPPPDRLETQKRNRRFNYETENQYEVKHRSRYEKHSAPMKHQLLSDHEEPASKRIRTRSSNRNIEHERTQNKPLAENAIPSRITDPLQLTSCLSPDYIDPETVTPVKEIMSTADIKIEDPRLKSQKYVVENENDKVVLFTVTGRNVELKSIDYSTWDIKRVEVPEALKHPPHYTDELVQQLYQNVDKPVSYMTPESGEIQSENELYGVVTDSYFNDIYEEERQKVRDLHIDNLYVKEIKDLDSRKSRDSHSTNHTNDNAKQLDMPITEYVIDHSKQENKSDTRITIKLSKKETENSVKHKTNAYENRGSGQHSCEERVLSNRDIVEGDLALSDETSDNVDAQIKIKDYCRTRSQHNSLENKTSKKTTASSLKDNNTKERDISSTKQVEKSEEQLAEKTKKPKSKKKSHKSKDKSAELIDTENITVKNTAEQQKSKKEIKTTGQIQEKFTDLFGDSSSLITPEDLGISTMPATKYNPLFEDALDSSDIKIKVIAQPHKESEKKTSESSEVKEELSQRPKTKEKKRKSKTNDEKRSSEETREVERNENEKCQAVTKTINVVSSVIISTGFESQVPPEDNTEPVDRQADFNVINEVDNVQHNEVPIKLQPLQPAAALASSTPYKEQSVNICPEPEFRTVESSCHSNDSGAPRNENTTPSDSSSNVDLSSQMETDAPDIRIFVRRRRKAVKRTAT